MPLSFIFWLIYLLALIFSVWGYYPFTSTNYRPFGGSLLLFILIGILGWRVFGFAIQG
jgi:hypothetical protein